MRPMRKLKLFNKLASNFEKNCVKSMESTKTESWKNTLRTEMTGKMFSFTRLTTSITSPGLY